MALLGLGRERSRSARVAVGMALVLGLLSGACSGGGGAAPDDPISTATAAGSTTGTGGTEATPATTDGVEATPVVTGQSGRVASEPCEPRIETVEGQRMLIHCGPATARITVGGKTYVFEGGSCERADRYLAANIGRQVLRGDGKGVDQWYMGLLAGDFSDSVTGIDEQALSSLELTPLTGDGPFEGDIFVTWAMEGESGGLRRPEVTFSGEASSATFSGQGMLSARGRVAGSLECGTTARSRSG